MKTPKHINNKNIKCSTLRFFKIHKKNLMKEEEKKSRIRETKHLSTDADSSTDAIGGDRLG